MTLYRANNQRIICDKHCGLALFKGSHPEPIDEVYASTFTYGCEYCHEEKLPKQLRCTWYIEETTQQFHGVLPPEGVSPYSPFIDPYDEYIERYT